MGNDLEFVLVVCNDFGELLLHVLGVLGLITEPCERTLGTVDLATLDEETGRLWEESQSNGKNQRPQELNANRDTVCASVHAVLGGVADASGVVTGVIPVGV